MTKNIVRSNPHTTFISSVSGDLITDASSLGPEYWSSNLTMPVRFHSAVSTLLQQTGHHIFLEVGPHSTLKRPIRDICAEARMHYAYIPIMLRSTSCSETLLSAIGQLHQQGTSVNIDRLNPSGRVLLDFLT